MKFPAIFKPSDDDRYDEDHPGYHSKESGEGHEWHHHPEVRKYLLASFLLGVSVLGIYLAVQYTTDHWRGTSATIIQYPGACPGVSWGDQGQSPGQPGVCQYWHNYTTQTCISSKSGTTCYPVYHHDPRTKFVVAYNWTITNTDSQTHTTNTQNLNFTSNQDQYGFSWTVGQTVHITVDRYTGSLIFCC